MEEQVISFETAKLAKEKGLSQYGNYFYCENYGLCELGEESLVVFHHPKTQTIEVIYDCNSEFDEGERFYAVTQSLLQKWLRDIHNIHISVNPVFEQNSSNHLPISYDANIYWVFNNNIPNSIELERSYYKTYEDLLEESLIEALKLIK